MKTLILFVQLVCAWDLICNDVWYDIADRVFDCNSSDCKFQDRQRNSSKTPIIFVSQIHLYEFTTQKPKTPYIIVSSNNVDACAPYGHGTAGGGESLLNDENLVAWFATNTAASHKKLHPLPLGPKVQWHTRGFHQEEESKALLSTILENQDPKRDFFEVERPNVVDCHMTVHDSDGVQCKVLTNEQSRRSAASHFERFTKHHDIPPTDACAMKLNAKLQNATIDENHNAQLAYLQRLRCAKFVPVPEAAGLDTHRYYETLTMGAIPIVIDFPPMRELFEELPVLRVQKWSDVTMQLLETSYKELRNARHKYNWRRLQAEYWREKILRSASKLNAQ